VKRLIFRNVTSL